MTVCAIPKPIRARGVIDTVARQCERSFDRDGSVLEQTALDFRHSRNSNRVDIGKLSFDVVGVFERSIRVEQSKRDRQCYEKRERYTSADQRSPIRIRRIQRQPCRLQHLQALALPAFQYCLIGARLKQEITEIVIAARQNSEIPVYRR